MSPVARTDMPIVAWYIRKSTCSEKIQQFTLSAQVGALQLLCDKKFGDEWTKYRIYEDSATGTNMNRPGLQQMLADARSGCFTHLAFLAIDRLTRNGGELRLLIDELKRLGIKYLSDRENVEDEGPSGKLVFAIHGAVGEYEHDIIIDRIKKGMFKKAELGQWPGGCIPIGYSFDSKAGLQIDENDAPIVRKVFELYIEGKEGSSAIAQRLNREGFRTRRGRKFSRKSVLQILRNPMYVGRFRWQKQEFASPHPPIIAESTFAAAKQILDSRSEEPTGKRWHHQDERLLTGLIRCGRCRSGMVGVSGNKKGQKHSYYACTKRLESKECDQDYVRTDLIEPLILDEIQKVFRDEALLEEVWQSAQAQLAASAPQLEAEIKQMDRQRAKAQGALDRYFAAFEAGTMAPADCSLRVAELTAQMKQFDEQLASLREQRAALDLPAIRADFLNEILTNLSGVVGAIPAPQKKHLLRLLVEKVLVRDRCTFEVWYRLPQFPEVRTLGELVAPTGLEPVLPP